MFRRDYFEEIQGRPGRVDNFWVRADSAAAVPQVIETVNSQFANSSAETQCDSEAVFLGSVIGRFRLFFTLARILGLIVALTIGLVAANAAAMSIRERRNEIAVMRSIGFRSPVILRLLVAESVVTALTGCILGCGETFGLLKIFSVTSDVLGPFVGAVQIPGFSFADRHCCRVDRHLECLSPRAGSGSTQHRRRVANGGLNGDSSQVPPGAACWFGRVSNAMTGGGIALVVTVFVIVMAMVAGLSRAIRQSGSDDNLIVLSRGSTTETGSSLKLDQFDAPIVPSPVSAAMQQATR